LKKIFRDFYYEIENKKDRSERAMEASELELMVYDKEDKEFLLPRILQNDIIYATLKGNPELTKQRAIANNITTIISYVINKLNHKRIQLEFLIVRAFIGTVNAYVGRTVTKQIEVDDDKHQMSMTFMLDNIWRIYIIMNASGYNQIDVIDNNTNVIDIRIIYDITALDMFIRSDQVDNAKLKGLIKAFGAATYSGAKFETISEIKPVDGDPNYEQKEYIE
jgi:hypothetical protein